MDQHHRAQEAVLVTGASSGIGAACALRLARQGYTVFAGVRTQADGETLRSASSRLIPLLLDVTDPAVVHAAVQFVTTTLDVQGSTLKGLINNAGIAVPGPLECIQIDDLRKQLEVNLVGVVQLTQAVLPLLRRHHGRIIMVGSLSGRLSTPFTGAYCAAKFGLEAITTALRMELAPWQIPVIMIETGAVQTPIWQKTLAAVESLEISSKEFQTLYGAGRVAMRRYVERVQRWACPPEAVAGIIVKALAAPHPRRRYSVGRDTRLAGVLRLLPAAVRETIIQRLL
ncbi:MAG: short-chain dehydrogenase/reductase [Herpetosiphonaceae bacterium]|nr:MAG: short-chain dehydrogenase/reductase [Herpetosiphonaceae bacterium]